MIIGTITLGEIKLVKAAYGVGYNDNSGPDFTKPSDTQTESEFLQAYLVNHLKDRYLRKKILDAKRLAEIEAREDPANTI